mmetsp:Transcript_4000/g.2964  ORF Transcript_4000/g.2964 Transcript_4000/m.2964 type:complete len:96 (-) Transcript_4000:1410-1697(-)
MADQFEDEAGMPLKISPELQNQYFQQIQKSAFMLVAILNQEPEENSSNLELMAIFNAVFLSRSKAEIISKLIQYVNFSFDKDPLLVSLERKLEGN